LLKGDVDFQLNGKALDGKGSFIANEGSKVTFSVNCSRATRS